MKRKILSLVIASLNLIFCEAQTLTRSQAIADIDEYNQVLKEVHYNPFLYITATDYARKTDSLKQTLADTLSLKAFVIKLSVLTASINDGHTMPAVVQPAFKEDFRKKIYFPLALSADKDGKLYTTKEYPTYGIPSGAILLTVNGINLSRLCSQAINYIGGLQPYKKQMALGLLGNYLYYSGITAPFTLTYNFNGQPRSTILKGGIILKDCLAMAFPQIAGTDYSFKIINHKIGYIDLISMGDDYKRYSVFFDSCFNAMKVAGVKTVAVDLRKNLGGNALIGDLLISYFNTKPYSLSGGRYWRVSQRYKDYLISRGDTGNFYLKQPNGTLIDQRRCGPRDPMFTNNNLLFDGKVYFITGPSTFSSATQLADAVKQYHMATIIGQPTGENTNDFGEVYRFTLVNSNIQMQVTTTFDLGADCNAKNNHPVVPDYTIYGSEVLLQNASDPAIQYILKHLQ